MLIIRRQAVDLLLGDRDNQKGRDALRFIKEVATGRNDVEDIKKGNYFVRAAWLGHCSGSNFGQLFINYGKFYGNQYPLPTVSR